MKPLEEVMEIFMNHCLAVVPGLLADISLPDFEEYIISPPRDVDKVTLAVYIGTGNHSKNYANETFMMQAQLPAVMDPIAHHSALSKAIRRFDPTTVLADSTEFGYVGFYPGEIQDGAGSSFLIYEISCLSDLDDCSDDENF